MATVNLLSFGNPVFASFVFYSTFLILKIFLVVFITVFHRIKNKVFPSEEDYPVDPKGEKPNAIRTHPDIERVRRIHHHDLENIPFFILLGFFYVLTDPAYATAIIVFRVYAAARVVHTTGYLLAFSPPRGMSFVVGLGCKIYLAVKVLQASKFLY